MPRRLRASPEKLGGRGARRPASELEAVDEWFRYPSASPPQYVETILKLPTKEQRRDRGASHPSLLTILFHILDNYRYWIEYAFEDRVSDFAARPPEVRATATDLPRYERDIDALVLGFVERLDSDQLDRRFSFHRSDPAGRVLTLAIRDML